MNDLRKSKYGAMILPDGKFYSLNDMETRLNNNVLVVGTTGSAKTRTVITPNLLECVGSYVVTDPKGNLYRQWGAYMEDHGYRVVRLSFIHPERSVHYNPMKYVNKTQQIQQLSSALVRNSGGYTTDPFWDDCSLMLINSIIALIKETNRGNADVDNFHTILELLRRAGRESSSNKKSHLYEKMEGWHEKRPNSWAYKQFQNVNQAPEKTFNTIITTSIAKFCSVDTEELAQMMQDDEIDLRSIGQRKTAVFVEVSDSDRSMDMLINMFFTQAMNQLCTYADEECENNQLPVPVRFFMDDFATNCRIDNFENMVSNIRSRKISVILILQSLSQLYKSYGASAHTIVDDCDTLIYMGGNDPETAHSIVIRCNKTTQTILHMPLRSSWIFRRGEKPFMCRNMELDTYLMLKDIVKKETAAGAITVEQNARESKMYHCTEGNLIEKAG
ncbi:MAG: type IV secretory system conjugative DNA transfer family protein [Acetatifactor sp.]|nr:type IV secretory system conjugative DNA transfer family protein [Acetatifactor sp.]